MQGVGGVDLFQVLRIGVAASTEFFVENGGEVGCDAVHCLDPERVAAGLFEGVKDGLCLEAA